MEIYVWARVQAKVWTRYRQEFGQKGWAGLGQGFRQDLGTVFWQESKYRFKQGSFSIMSSKFIWLEN